MNRTVKIVLGVVLVLAVAGGSFVGGMAVGKSQARASLPSFDAAGGPPGMVVQGSGRPAGQSGAGSTRGGMLAGEIVSIDAGVLTLKDQSGEQVQVHVTDTTLIQKQADVTIDDLEAGETVFVSGTRGDDGSYTARSVQVSSQGLIMGGPGGPMPGQPGPDTATALP